MKKMLVIIACLLLLVGSAQAWFDETHVAIAKAAGYRKWYNAAAADVARAKLGKKERDNHYHNGPRGIKITPEMVLRQANMYDKVDPGGHLYGAVVASFRSWRKAESKGGYAENELAYLVHYIGDLSMPLHHIMYNDFNKANHAANDGVIDDDVFENFTKIRIYDIKIGSESDLVAEVARIANLSKELGHRLEDENRLLTADEAYHQISHSASLLKAVLAYAGP